MTRDWFAIGGVFALVAGVSAIFFRWLRAIERRRDEALREVGSIDAAYDESMACNAVQKAELRARAEAAEQLARERHEELMAFKTRLEAAEKVRADTATRALGEMRAVAQSYFDAIDWVAADSFDMCEECRSKLAHAQANGRAALSKTEGKLTRAGQLMEEVKAAVTAGDVSVNDVRRIRGRRR